jgi:hypothetical protein
VTLTSAGDTIERLHSARGEPYTELAP